MATQQHPPPLDTPHLHLSHSLAKLHPEHISDLGASAFDVFQKTTDDDNSCEGQQQWTQLGTYQLAAKTEGEAEGEPRIEDGGGRIFLSDGVVLERAQSSTGVQLPSPAVEEVVEGEVVPVEVVEVEAEQASAPVAAEPEHMQVDPEPVQVNPEPVQLPPTPPAADEMPPQVEPVPPPAVPQVPIEETPVTPPAIYDDPTPPVGKKEAQEAEEHYSPPRTPTAESYADLLVSMSESQYSNISGHAGESDDAESDRWSVLSTGPVDRQWTVVFEEKEEMV